MDISVTLIVKNGERRLNKVLEALRPFTDVVVYDTGSTDRTLEIARTFPNTRIFQNTFHGFGPAHNHASSLALHDWILSIDADEVLSSELVDEIRKLTLNPQTVYDLPFHNFFNGRHIKWCGWYPESHIRFFNRKTTAFSEAMVHEGVISKNLKIVKLRSPVLHYSYDSLSDFLVKMERYSTLFAMQYKNQRKSSPLIALKHGLGAFLKSYLLKRGFLGGYEGFLISIYNGHTAFYKYLKLYQANRETCNSP